MVTKMLRIYVLVSKENVRMGKDRNNEEINYIYKFYFRAILICPWGEEGAVAIDSAGQVDN